MSDKELVDLLKEEIRLLKETLEFERQKRQELESTLEKQNEKLEVLSKPKRRASVPVSQETIAPADESRLIEEIRAEDAILEAYRRGLFHIKPEE
ncbi:MAG: hypothetical protein ACXQTL_05975 [Methanosarcinales archaeon]